MSYCEDLLARARGEFWKAKNTTTRGAQETYLYNAYHLAANAYEQESLYDAKILMNDILTYAQLNGFDIG